MLGRGNTAEVFEYGNGKVCKLFFEGYPQKYIEHEYLNKMKVSKMDITKHVGVIEQCREYES